MIADFLPVLLQVLLWVLQTLLVLLGAVMAVLVAFVVLPVVVRVEAGRGPESDATPDVDAVVAPWFGALAVGVHQVVDGWEGRLLLLGRFCLYRRLVVAEEGSEVPAPPEPRSEVISPDPVTPSPAPSSARAKSGTSTSRPTPRPTTEHTGDTAAATPSPVAADDSPAEPGLLMRIREVWHDVRPFLPPTKRLLRSLLRVIGLRRVQIDATVGLDDAAATGKLMGQAQAIRPFLPPWTHVAIQADFVRPSTHGSASLILHVYLARLVAAAGRFGLHAGYLWLRRWWRLRQTARTLSAVTD